jgi:alanyl-tRNA synthetase
MNWALREVLGDHVQQKGSLVDDEKTRFDLSHNAAITEQELAKIESLTNEQIGRDLIVYTENEVDQTQARQINTLRAVFGEKYPEKVRVVSVGAPIGEMLADPKNAKWMGYSVEFCGGTHVKRTGEIGRFRLIEESAVSKGIRRVVGITGQRADEADKAADAMAAEFERALKSDGPQIAEMTAALTTKLASVELPVLRKQELRAKLATLQEKAKQAQKDAAKAGTANVMSQVDDLLANAVKAGSISIVCGLLSGATADQLRAAADSLRAKAGSAAVLLASDEGGKATLLAAMTPDVVQKGIKAGDLIKEIAPVVGGKGGGRPDMAQGGGPDAGKIGDAVGAAQAWLRGELS